MKTEVRSPLPFRWMRSRLSFPRCDRLCSISKGDRVSLLPCAIAFLFWGMRSRLSSPTCDRVSVSVDALAYLFPHVRSRLSVGGCDRVYLAQSAIAFECRWMRSRLSVPRCDRLCVGLSDRVYLPQCAIAILTNQPSSNGFTIFNPSMRLKSSTLRVTNVQPSTNAQAAIKASANLTR